MWTADRHTIEDDRINRLQILANGTPISFNQVIANWNVNEEFRAFYNHTLASAEFESFFWEHPPLTNSEVERSYECVLVKGGMLNFRKPDVQAFQNYFEEDKHAVTFFNLGKDAELIVPTPEKSNDVYPHLAQFVRNASSEQIDAFWELVGKTFKSAIGERKKWLSTAGLGVSWLHVRIDNRPKYYRYKEFKEL